MKKKKGKLKKRLVGAVKAAVAHISATFNNTIITITDKTGNTLTCASPGVVGFSGSKKSTPFAAQLAAREAAKRAKELGIQEVEIKVKGAGSGREAAVRAIQASGLAVKSIKDVTPTPHDGCRPRKRRRV